MVMIQPEYARASQPELDFSRAEIRGREIIPAPNLIRFTSTQELVCGLMMKKYLPDFDLVLGDTYQVEIGRKRAVDFAFRGERGKREILFEYHPIILHQEFRDRDDFKKLKELVAKLPEAWQQQSLLHALNEEFGNLYIERRTALIRASYFKHIREKTTLITALSPSEFIDKILIPFGDKLPRMGRKYLLEEWNNTVTRFKGHKTKQVIACDSPLSIWGLEQDIIFETNDLLSDNKSQKLQSANICKREEYAVMVTLFKLITDWHPQPGKTIEYPIGAGARVNFCAGDTLIQLSFAELREYFYSDSRYDLVMQISGILPKEEQRELLDVLNREYRRQYEKRYQQLVATCLDPRVHNRKLLCVFTRSDLYDNFFDKKVTRRTFENVYRKALRDFDQLQSDVLEIFASKK